MKAQQKYVHDSLLPLKENKLNILGERKMNNYKESRTMKQGKESYTF